MHSRRVAAVAALSLLVLALTGCEVLRETFGIGSQVNNPWTQGEDLSGTTVTVVAAFTEGDAEQFKASMEPFEVQTGITVNYDAPESFETEIAEKLASSDPPDVVGFPQPGLLREYIESEDIEDVLDMVGETQLNATYDESWRSMATHQDIEGGVWYRAAVKSLVWYPHPEFTNAGYEIPTSWTELIALSDDMVANGETPWSIGIESGNASGWVATDWMEDIMLRTVPAETYDKWITGDLKFDSTEVRRAATEMADIWFETDYVLGGKSSIAQTSFGDANDPLEANPPEAWLHRQASFLPGFFGSGITIGDDMRFFYLPPIDEEEGNPVLVGGDIMSPTNTEPATAALIRYLASGESIRKWIEAGSAVAPHKDAELDWYPDEWTRKYAEILRDADTVRFDASDVMPAEVGTGAFWTEMVNWVNGKAIDDVLADIDAAWP